MIVGDEKNRDEDLSPLECLKTLEILKPVKNDKSHAREHRDCIIGIKSWKLLYKINKRLLNE